MTIDEDVDWDSIISVIGNINKEIDCNNCIHSVDIFCGLTGEVLSEIEPCDKYEEYK